MYGLRLGLFDSINALKSDNVIFFSIAACPPGESRKAIGHRYCGVKEEPPPIKSLTTTVQQRAGTSKMLEQELVFTN